MRLSLKKTKGKKPSNMRFNSRKVILVLAGVAFLWLIVAYSSLESKPRVSARQTVHEFEKKIMKLEQKLSDQIVDSSRLLESVKTHLKKSETDDSMVGADRENEMNVLPEPGRLVLPVLVIACDRVTVRRCLNNLLLFRPSKETFPIIVSQDCGHNATYQVIKSFVDEDPSISVVTQPDQSEIPLSKTKVKFRGYYKIARHYKFALNHVLNELGHEAVIIVEDDLDISPDFFEYFLGTYPLLHKDPSLWCISAWNDNGKKEVIDSSSPVLLHRTDFFPGLGWCLRRQTWQELEANWPPAFFDDWLRNPENVKNRACIRPEISRTYSFGRVGVSRGLFFDKHLRNIKLNLNYYEFTKLDLNYLIKDIYDPALEATVEALPVVSAAEALSSVSAEAAVRVTYTDAASYRRNAKALGLMDDFRSGVPRTAYRGIVTCYVKGRRVYLTPGYEWTHYDPSWG